MNIPKSKISKRGAAGEDPCILLVEDNLINCEVLKVLLKSFEMQVDTAHNGLEAVHKCAGKNYDLILMDIQMPEMDGLEATRAIRAMTDTENCNSSIPILALTASTYKEDLQACLEAGMNGHISKPVNPESFLAILNKWRGKSHHDHNLYSSSATAGLAKTASTDDEAICRKLNGIDGLEFEEGLSNFQGNVQGYLALLHEFDVMLTADMERLKLLVAGGEAEKACAVTHTFKGVAGTLALSALQSRTIALEKGLRGRLDADENNGGGETAILLEKLNLDVKKFHHEMESIKGLA